MPKLQVIDPVVERTRGALAFPEVPLNAYDTPMAKEATKYGKDALIGIYEDMCLIREFEEMLQAIKTEGSYQGIAYDHKGPAHLSIGQESAAVGQAFLLDIDDHIYGSHRSHGEILAKGMSAIRKWLPPGYSASRQRRRMADHRPAPCRLSVAEDIADGG